MSLVLNIYDFLVQNAAKLRLVWIVCVLSNDYDNEDMEILAIDIDNPLQPFSAISA